MERQPIISEHPESIAIKMVQAPLTLRELLPTYQFQFQSGEISDEAVRMYEEFVEFLTTNEELAVPENDLPHKDEYVKGFQRAVALMRLWIDSIYLSETTE